MTTIKFYNEGTDWSPAGSVANLLSDSGYFTEVTWPHQASLVVFNGGADIATEIYGEKPVMKGVPEIKSRRDVEELDLFKDCVSEGRFMLGICRGAQLLNCLNGGKLWQHADRHGRDHNMVDLKSGTIYQATSTHHQMMRPAKTAELIAVAAESTLKMRDGENKEFTHPRGEDITLGDDVEIVYYAGTRSLCIQGHPEYVPNSEFADYCIDLIRHKYEGARIVQAT